MASVIKYRGILTEMYVTGFSEPMDVDGSDEPQRSVKASNLIADAMVFADDAIEEALTLTRKCQPTAASHAIGQKDGESG